MRIEINNLIKLDKMPYKYLKLINNIVDFEGLEILTHYTDVHNNNVLYYLIDYTPDSFYFLAWENYSEQIDNLHTGDLSILACLLNRNNHIYIIERALNGIQTNAHEVRFEDIPVKYLPKKDSFLN